MQGFTCANLFLEHIEGGAGTVVWVILVLLVAQIIGAICLHFHLRTQYGRHLIELKRVVADLDGD